MCSSDLLIPNRSDNVVHSVSEVFALTVRPGAVASVRMMKLRIDVHIARFLQLIPVLLRPCKVPFTYARHVRDVCAADARIAAQIAS